MVHRTKERIKKTAEVFTPPQLVNEMLDKLPDEVWQDGKTFIDPFCGNGNFLIEVFQRKINKGHDVLNALKTIYGVDIMKDNIQECKERLLAFVPEVYHKEAMCVMELNIVWLDLAIFARGSFDYDFEFNGKSNKNPAHSMWD